MSITVTDRAESLNEAASGRPRSFGASGRLDQVVILVLLVLVSTGCRSHPPAASISREAAVERARMELTFEPETTRVEAATESGRRVWRVTFQGPPMAPGHPLRPTLIVIIDRETGQVLGLAQS